MAGRSRDISAVAPASRAEGWKLAVRATFIAALILALLGTRLQWIQPDAISVLSTQPMGVTTSTAAKVSRLDVAPDRSLPAVVLPPKQHLPTNTSVHRISVGPAHETACAGHVDHSHRARAPPPTPKSTLELSA